MEQDTLPAANIAIDHRTGSVYLDSLSQGQNMRKLFFLNERIVGEAKSMSKIDLERNLHGIKLEVLGGGKLFIVFIID